MLGFEFDIFYAKGKSRYKFTFVHLENDKLVKDRVKEDLLIISQNLMNYDMPFPPNTVLRINLAWINNLEEFVDILKKHNQHSFFVDLPIKRVKPPNNKYEIEDLIPILEEFKEIQYFAISNVESSKDLEKYLNVLPDHVTIVPKIESPGGITNIEDILSVLPYKEKIIMLDHDDLYSNLAKNNEPASSFKEWIKKLVDYCEKNNIILLRTRGVIFSDTL